MVRVTLKILQHSVKGFWLGQIYSLSAKEYAGYEYTDHSQKIFTNLEYTVSSERA